MRYAQIALDVPLYSPLTYKVPEGLRGVVQVGQLVQVPFRNKAKTGLVLELTEEPGASAGGVTIRELLDVVDPEPVLDARGIEFLKFVAEYYFSPIGEVVRLAIPSSVRLDGVKCYQRIADMKPPADLDDDLLLALNWIKEDEAIPIRDIKEKFPYMTFLRLGLLEELNLVKTTYQEEVKVKALTERYYKLVREPDPFERLGDKQLQLIELLEEAGEEGLSLTAIRERVESPHASLKSLEGRGLVASSAQEVYRDPFTSAPVERPARHQATATQERAARAVARWGDEGKYQGFLLHGVTGSGKTEVYVRIIEDTLKRGKRGIILLPEIALTPQFVGVFRGHFGDNIAVLHSGLTAAEKFDQWRRIKRSEVDVVIGARSAIFAPVSSLGVIIVDEEHDPSFKQEEGTRYNARDMALVRGKIEDVQVVLGSATPSLESYYNAIEGRLQYLEMPTRVAARPLPKVELVDLRGGKATQQGGSSLLSATLISALTRTITEKHQAIVFLNRRGYSPCILCQECGYIWMCHQCDVSMTYHRAQESLRCHHCDYSLRLPEVCPQCGKHSIDTRGIGTEQLEEHMRRIFTQARIARLDRDTGTGKSLQSILQDFRDGEIDLLVGTQMVTKGHDFPRVTCVGVVSADQSLNFPDFRAAERTFQLLTQVSGRAGRGTLPGEVFIQTYNPEHFSLQTSKDHDYKAFAEQEIAIRREIGYPPFGHLIAVKFEAASDQLAYQTAKSYASAARKHLRSNQLWGDNVFMLGPALAPLTKLKGKSRWQILLKSGSRVYVRQLTRAMLDDVGFFDPGAAYHRQVRVIVDVDPINML
jgi:primosomal protein N' (replication factor Y)